MGEHKFINSIDDLKPGDHLCQIYETEKEHHDLLLPFLLNGLKRNEKIIYVVDTHTSEHILDYIKEAGVDTKKCVDSGQLNIITRDDSYMKQGFFDPELMIGLLRSETDKAIKEGYTALRVTGEMTWALKKLPGSERLIEYESKLNDFFPGSKALAICQYDKKQFDASVLLNIVKTHPFAVIGTEIYTNQYYLPPNEFINQDSSDTVLDFWLKNLAERKEVEDQLRLNETRLEALLQLNGMGGKHLAEIATFALEEGVRLTSSKIGYVAFVNEDETLLTMHAWSAAAMKECAVQNKPIEYPVNTTGLWGEAVRQRKPIITNDYNAPNPWKRGTPEGHVRVERHMNLPVFDGDKIVIVAGVGNKDTDYDESDVRQLTLLMSGLWRTVQHNKAEAARRESEQRLHELNVLQGLLLAPKPIEQKLKLITDAVVRIMDADFARIWMIKPGDRCAGCVHAQLTEGPHICRFRDRCLHLLASSGRYTDTEGPVHGRVPFDCYKIGKIASGEDSKFLTNEVTTDPHIHNHAWAKELGLASFAGYRMVDTSGHPIGVLALFSKHAIMAEEDSFLEGIANATSHVLHSERADVAIRESEEYFRTIFDAAMDGILIADSENKKFVMGNSSICQQTGYSPEEIKGLGVMDIHPEKDLPYVVDKFERQVKGEFTLARDIPIRRKDGTVFYADVNSSTATVAGNRMLIGVFRDITERKENEKRAREWTETLAMRVAERTRELKEAQEQLTKKEKLAMIGELAGTVAHELRSPLNTFNSSFYLIKKYLAKTNAEEKLNKHVELIEKELKHSNHIINGILTFARMKDPVFEEVNLHDALEDCLVSLSPGEKYKVENNIDRELICVDADKVQIRVVFSNIITNSIEAMLGGGKITVTGRRLGECIDLEFTDCGCGVPKEIVDKIFEPLVTGKFHGAGLGLATCKNIIEAHRGSIRSRNNPQGGTTFTVSIPIKHRRDHV